MNEKPTCVDAANLSKIRFTTTILLLLLPDPFSHSIDSWWLTIAIIFLCQSDIDIPSVLPLSEAIVTQKNFLMILSTGSQPILKSLAENLKRSYRSHWLMEEIKLSSYR